MALGCSRATPDRRQQLKPRCSRYGPAHRGRTGPGTVEYKTVYQAVFRSFVGPAITIAGLRLWEPDGAGGYRSLWSAEATAKGVCAAQGGILMLREVSGGGLAHQGHTPSTSGSRPSWSGSRALSSANARSSRVRRGAGHDLHTHPTGRSSAFPDSLCYRRRTAAVWGSPGTVQAVQYFVDSALRLLPGVGSGLDGFVHADRVQVELVDQEVVGVFGLDVPVGPCFGGEVGQVECDDDLRRCPDRSIGGRAQNLISVLAPT